jgi:hypothetical protein
MRIRSIKKKLLGLATTLVLATSACQRPSPPAAADCPGASAAEAELDYHPRILRGQVSAPAGALSSSGGLFDGWLVGTAHAAPLEEERPAAAASVTLYRVDARGQRSGEVLRQTTTDLAGKWCMKLPDGVDYGADLVVEARDQARLRRVVVSEFATDIYSTSEALYRLLQRGEVDFTQLSTEAYFNLESIAASAVDLLDPVELEPTDGVDEAVDKIVAVLEDDPRLTAKLTPAP